jgi:anti-sigma regulatory factor (Ser/Thr protein kinase)
MTDIRLEIRAEPRLLRSVRGLLRCYLEDHGFDEDRVNAIVLAVDEACTNSIRHAYGGCGDNVLALSIGVAAASLEVVLVDDGCPAPREVFVKKPFTAPDLESLKPGGLGIPLIFATFDEVEFRPGERRGNRLTMRLKRPDIRSGTGGNAP